MAHDTRSSRKIKDDENNNSKGRQSSSKGSSTSGSGASDTSGLRRSARDTSKKDQTQSPSGTRKSERLENKTPETLKRTSERFEKKSIPSLLRRSDRTKNHSSTSSAPNKSDSGSPLVKPKKDQKEKSVKELTLAAREVSESEKQSAGPSHMKKKIKSGRAYKALFKTRRRKLNARGNSEEQSRQIKVSQGGSNDCEGVVKGLGKGDERREEEQNEEFVGRVQDGSLVGSDSSVNKFAKVRLDDNRGVDLSCSSPRLSCMEEASEFGDGDGLEVCGQHQLPSSDNAVMEEINDAPESVHVDGGIHDVLIGSKSGHCVTPSKRKRNIADGKSDTSAAKASKDVCTLIADAVSSLPSGSATDVSVETCSACFKRQRVENHPTNLEFCACSTKINQELRSAPATEKKEFSIDLQTNGDHNTCLICSLDGKLLCCDGRRCRRSYHLSCLDPPVDSIPLGDWYCSMCVRKKMECGMHSVSEGIESIWDAREVEASDVDGLQKRKEFFVKYKGLAHIHNQWLPESEVLLEAPTLVAKFNSNNQVTRWKKEWTVPRRLLQRRSLMSPKQRDIYIKEHTGDKLICHYEWLVKWHGLGYDVATWELENAAFLNSPEGLGLIRDYENRRQRVKKISHSSEMDKILEGKKTSSVKLSRLPAGDLSGFDNTCLDNVNKLRELWHKGQNAVVVDDKERMVKVIAFILSLHSDVHRPFLIISTPSTLCCWDDEFFRLAPSINVVVYSGHKELRRSIRTMEFDEAGGCIMGQVLVTTPEAIIEDKNVFECIGWETIIIDECQRPRISKQLVRIKMLDTRKWLLLVSGILKESSAEYLTLLSLLDSHNNSENGDHLLASSTDIIGKLKERLSRYIVYGRKTDSSRFREYWVPVQMSKVQLEQYCENILSNSTLILSLAKKDLVGALHDILLSARKCCDHPYIVHPSLQALLTKDLQAVEYLDVGIKASGKLRLLDMMLKEIKNRSLRVLILFQSISGSGSFFSLGDILDDFLRQRFGENSYERVECGVVRTKKEAAMNAFNNKEMGRFVFLLEARACLPSIKLSSVDTVIIFGSDWNPHNDIRALQRISLDSQFEQIKVFRLYSICTVEEKLLVRAKQGKILDNHAQNISSNMLLWGTPYQFDELDEFHGCSTPASTASILSEESLVKDVIQEFLSILPQVGNNNDLCDFSIISKAQQNGGVYSTEVPLLSEMKSKQTGEGKPLSFWTKLLEGKHPQWKYCSGLPPRHRKRVQNLDELSKKPEDGCDEVVKKRKKVVNQSLDSRKPGSEWKSVPGYKEGGFVPAAYNVPCSSPKSTACANKIIDEICASTSNYPESNMFESEERRKLCDAQKSLHLLLKPKILKLCGILQVSDAVKVMVEQFLEYVMSNHHVTREPATILQAFQISLCWTAASFLKQKVNHKESLALAKQLLNFNCKKEEADYVYSMLRCLKKTFLYRTGIFKAAAKLSSMDALKNSHANCSEVNDMSLNPESLAQKDVSKSIKEIQKKLQKQMTKLMEKQSKDRSEVLKTYQEENGHLERESVVIRSCFQNNTSMRTDKLKMLKKKFEENTNNKNLHLERLEASQKEARNKLKEMGKRWVEEVQSWACVELLNRSPSKIPEPSLDWSGISECLRIDEDREDFVISREHDVDSIAHSMTEGVIPLSQTPESVPNEVVACSGLTRTEMTPVRPLGANGELDTTSGAASCTDFIRKNKPGSSSDDQENAAPANPCAKMLITNGGIPGNREVLPDVPEVACSTDGLQKVEVRPEVHGTACSTDGPQGPHPLNLSSVQQNSDGAALYVPDREVQLRLEKTVNSSHGLQDVSVRPPSSKYQNHAVTGTRPDKEVKSGVLETLSSNDGLEDLVSVDPPSAEQTLEKATECETSSSSHGLHNIVSVNPTSSEEQIQLVMVTTPDKEVESGVLETVRLNDGLENLVSGNPPSSEREIPEKSTEHGTLSSGHGFDNVVCPPSSEEQIHVVTVPMPDKEVDLAAVHQTVNPDDGPPSSDEQISENATEKDNSATGICQQNGVHTAVNGSSCQEIPLVNSTGVQPVALVPGSSVTLDQACQDKGALLESSAAVQGVAEASEKQNACQVVENPIPESAAAVASNLSNHELPFSNTPDHSTRELSSAGGVEIQPSSEDRTFTHVAHAPVQLIENLPNHNQTVLRPVTCSTSGLALQFSEARATPVTSAFNSRPMNPAQGASRMPVPVCPDPLQNELERLNKQTDHILKSHEDTKLRLKTDRDKEIEEAVAEIRRKYEIRFQEIEAEFLLKKKELDSIHNKVLMNKILAEAFRSKCMDLRASGASGVQQEGNSSFAQQLAQLSMHDTQGHSPASSLSLASHTAASLQTSIAPLPIPQMTTPAPAPNPHCTDPPVQTVPLAPAIFPSIPTRPPCIPTRPPSVPARPPSLPARPPLISSISSTGILQGGGEIRAPAPHLQPFRPSTSMSNQQSHSNSLAMLPSLPHIPQLPSPTQQSVPHNTAHHPESEGDLAALRSLSALGLLMNMNSRAGVNLPGSLPSQPNLVSNHDQLNDSVNPVNTGGSTDIVCLSDDD